MRTPRRRFPESAVCRTVLIAGMLAGGAACHDAWADTASQMQRNAIFNGDFADGRAGWTIMGPPDLDVEAHHRMVAHRSDSELSVRHSALEQGFAMFSPYGIKVTPGTTYTLTLTARGAADMAFGVYEYAERDRNTIFPISERLDLKPEAQTFTFRYEASEEAATIRPRIVFFGRATANTGVDSAPGRGGTGKLDVRLMNFELLLPEAEFRETTNWPEWAVSGELSAYQGMSEDEVRKIREAVTVTERLASV